jgi:hypothetical protein
VFVARRDMSVSDMRHRARPFYVRFIVMMGTRAASLLVSGDCGKSIVTAVALDANA